LFICVLPEYTDPQRLESENGREREMLRESVIPRILRY